MRSRRFVSRTPLSSSISFAKGWSQFDFDCREHWRQLEPLAERYADRKPDLGELCLVRMSELHPRHSVIAVDRGDFRICRRNERESIPILCPPGV